MNIAAAGGLGIIDGVTFSILDLTASGLLGIGILLLFLGKLHTNTAYQAMQRAYENQAAASDKLRDTNQIQAKTIEKQADTIRQGQVVGDIVTKTMEALQAQNQRDQPHPQTGGETP